MYATRHKPAVIGGPCAQEGAPYYDDNCVYNVAPLNPRTDAEGRTLVWFPDAMAGALLNGMCAACGKPFREQHDHAAREQAYATGDWSAFAPPPGWDGKDAVRHV